MEGRLDPHFQNKQLKKQMVVTYLTKKLVFNERPLCVSLSRIFGHRLVQKEEAPENVTGTTSGGPESSHTEESCRESIAWLECQITKGGGVTVR